MKRFIALLIASLLLLVSCSSGAELEENTSSWVGGYAECELIPENPTTHNYYIAGYKNDNPATGILDYQKVRAVYLEAGGKAVIWMAVDCVALSSSQVDEIIKETDLPDSITIHVVSTHTHAGIDTFGLWGPIAIDGKDEEFNEQIIKKAGETACAAYAARKTGKLFYGSTSEGIENLQHDSRAPRVYDKNLYQLRFEADEGSGFRIFDYAAHAEALRGDNTLISADYPAYLCNAVLRETGDNAMYLPGAVGGLIMTQILKDREGNELSVTENVVETGELLANAALRIENERELLPTLVQATREISVPLDNKVYIAMKALGILTNEIESSGEGEYGLSIKTRVSLTRLGDLYIVSVPGELFPELAYGSGKQNGVAATISEIINDDFIVVGLCDDEIGYIVPPSDFLLNDVNPYIESVKSQYGENHYEETNTVGPLAAERLLSAIEELYKSSIVYDE